MTRHSVPVARIFGISISLDYSWFLIFVLFTWALASGYYPAAYPTWSRAEYWIMGAVTALMLFVCVLLHELGHSVVAMRYQIPVRSITLFIFGGVSQIEGESHSASAEFWIAIAGPVVSGALAVAFALLRPALAAVGPLLALTTYLAYINGALAVFNLIPGFPLDGGRVLRAVLWSSTHSLRKATLAAATVGRFVGFIFIVWGVAQIFAGQLANGLWIAFIGWFLESAANAQVQQQVVGSLLAGHTASEAMDPHYVSTPAATHLQDLVDRHILGSGSRAVVVTRDDEPVGLVTVHQIAAVPRDRWPTSTVADAMTSIASVKRIKPTTGLWEAMTEMDHDGVNQLPVTEDGRILGMLTRADVISYLRTLQELGR
jgi:Zn-dependent protease/CBS domain-containing protein